MVLYCQHCGESQLVTARGLVLRTVLPCVACGGLQFNTRHPQHRDPNWVSPGYSAHDLALLAEARIASEDARYGVVAARGTDGGEWWLVVDERARELRATVVRSFGPQHPHSERQARAHADVLNRLTTPGLRADDTTGAAGHA